MTPVSKECNDFLSFLDNPNQKQLGGAQKGLMGEEWSGGGHCPAQSGRA